MKELKTLHDLFWGENINCCLCGNCDQGCGCDIEKIRKEAIKWMKSKKDINIADWIEFFNIEKEFGDLCLCKNEEDLK